VKNAPIRHPKSEKKSDSQFCYESDSATLVYITSLLGGMREAGAPETAAKELLLVLLSVSDYKRAYRIYSIVSRGL